MRNNPPLPTWLVVCCVAMLALVLFVGPLAATLAQTPTPEPSYEELLAEEFGAKNYSLEKVDVGVPALYNAASVYVLVDRERHIVCYITREGIACMNDIEYGK